MTESFITTEMLISNLSGSRGATEIIDALEDDDSKFKISLEVRGYNSEATEPGEGPKLDIELQAMSEVEMEKSDERPYVSHHHITVHAGLNKAQARALRDHINVFLELE